MIAKAIDKVTIADIDLLVTNRVKESRTLEYKSAFPGKANSDTIPFLAEICAFANSVGGDFIIGISEEDGFASSISGLSIENVDQELQRLESLIRNGIEPRLSTAFLRHIDCSDGKLVIVIRIKRSWNAPHRVISNSKFYGRNSSGKYPMDIVEIRNAFDLSSSASDRIRGFRAERISRLMTADDLPMDIRTGGIVALHIIPLQSLSNPTAIDVEGLSENPHGIWPIGSRSFNSRINLDGVVSFSGGYNSPVRAYTQIYRHGIIEAVTVLREEENEDKCIAIAPLEGNLLSSIKSYCNLLQELEIEPPLSIFLSLIRVRGYNLAVGPRYDHLDRNEPLRRDTIELPEIVLSSFHESYEKPMQPLFNMFWNAFGFSRSLCYDNDDNWKGLA